MQIINGKKLNRFVRKYNIKNCFDNIDSFFDSCPDVDFIIISTPGFTHFELCQQVLDRNLNVLVEKPVTLDLDEATALRKYLKRGGFLFCES